MLTALFLSVPLAAAGGPRCLLPELGAPPPLDVPARHALDGDKTERDATGTYPYMLTSANFALKWGSRGGVTEEEAQDLIDAFEAAWAVEIEEMAHPGPAGTDTSLFNIYIGDTGDGAPSGYGAGGYYWTDDEGWPMVVVARESLYDQDYADVVAAHEFYHAVQDSIGTFSYDGDSAWYWEATADWAAGEVFPGNPDYAVFLFGYAFLPHLALDYFDYPDSGALQEYHQYGAFIFPRYLSEVAADWTLIRDSWLVEDADDPIEAIDGLLVERGSSMSAIFPDYAAHNATWDYVDREIYEEMLAAYEGWYASGDHRVVAEIAPEGTDGEVEADEDLLPQRYGYNVLVQESPQRGPLFLSFAGDLVGSEGSDASFGVVAVLEAGGEVSYAPMSLEDNTGELELEVPADASAVHLVVSAWSGPSRNGETFAYRYRFASDDITGVPPIDSADTGDGGDSGDSGAPYEEEKTTPAGCGCASGSSGGAPGVGLVGLAFLLRRLRGRRRSL